MCVLDLTFVWCATDPLHSILAALEFIDDSPRGGGGAVRSSGSDRRPPSSSVIESKTQVVVPSPPSVSSVVRPSEPGTPGSTLSVSCPHERRFSESSQLIADSARMMMVLLNDVLDMSKIRAVRHSHLPFTHRPLLLLFIPSLIGVYGVVCRRAK
jgi:hypothetical protein